MTFNNEKPDNSTEKVIGWTPFRISYLGIGNTLLKDEGIGIHLLDYIQKAYLQWEWQFDIQLIDGGTLSFDLLTLICSTQKLIILDAVRLKQPAGSVYCLQDQAMDQFLVQPGKSVHEVSLQDLFDMSRLTEQLPEHRALIGIEPETIDWRSQLTSDVNQFNLNNTVLSLTSSQV